MNFFGKFLYQAVPQDGQLLKAKAFLTIALYMEHHLEFQVPWDSITFYREIMSEANI